MSTTINNPQPSYVYAGGGGGGGGGLGVSGVGTITTAAWQNPNPSVKIDHSGVVQLSGFGADVVINGVSLTETLKAIQDRLGILRPSMELEAEWDELQELGRLYRQKEAELKEKKRMWEIMKREE
jgi:hypothetical protein